MIFASRNIRHARRLAAAARSRGDLAQDVQDVKDVSFTRFAATVSRRDLRSAATAARVVARWAGDLADGERDEAERIATRLDELAATKVHTPEPEDEHSGAAGALAGSLLNEGTAEGLEASPTRPTQEPAP